MKALIPSLAAGALTLAAAFAFAQGAPGSGPGMGPGMMGDGARMGGPGHGPHHEAMRGAYEACKGQADMRSCMTQQMCAKAQDSAQCQARAKERHARMNEHMDRQQAMHEACNGKRGDELANCLIGQRQKFAQQRIEERQKAHEACNGKRGEELTSCLQGQRKPRS